MGTAEADEFPDHHVAALIGAQVPRVNGSDYVDELGQRFENECANEADVRTKKKEDEINLGNCEDVACQVEDHAEPEGSGRLAMKLKELAL